MASVLDIWKSKIGKRVIRDEQPLRGELLSIEQLREHALSLAEGHGVTDRKGANRLLNRLKENEQILRDYNEQTLLVEKKRDITPAAEWMLDNFYVIEEQIHTARRHLPYSFNRQLPHLVKGPSVGYPRVYDIALNLIAHVDGRLDAEQLSSFVAAYQQVATLKLGELWAIPIMLRLALIENLRRLAKQLTTARNERDLADFWIDRLSHTAENDPTRLIVAVAQMAQADVPLNKAFVAEFSRRLKERNPALQLALGWIEQRLQQDGYTVEQLISAETQNQAATQVSTGNTITSLRFLDAMDWREFVETLSAVEQTLRTDPIDVYSDMDFVTRDAYRHSVEHLANFCPLSEAEVAQLAVKLAANNVGPAKDGPQSGHVGYYLIGKGLADLERVAGMKPPLRDLLRKFQRRFPLSTYLASILFLTALSLAPLLAQLRDIGFAGWPLVLQALLAAICLSHLALSLVNWLTTITVSPRLLPRLDFSDEIPPEHRTIVVIPTLLTSGLSVDRKSVV